MVLESFNISNVFEFHLDYNHTARNLCLNGSHYMDRSAAKTSAKDV